MAEHRYSIIWLHGLGADGHDFEGIVPELRLKEHRQTHYIFPDAPIQPVTINGGMKMRAWYDILEMSLQHQVDIDGIYQSSEMVKEMIDQELAKGIAANNIVLAGFSQGGVIALHTGLRYPQHLGGIIALSTYLPTIAQLSSENSPANQQTPIFMAHGILDSIVAIEAGKSAYNALKAMGYPIEWHDYLMEHAVCGEEISDISSFITRLFAASH